MKTLATIIAAHAVLLLEVVGLVLVCVAFGLWFGAPAVCLTLGLAVLAKSFELDLTDPRSRRP